MPLYSKLNKQIKDKILPVDLRRLVAKPLEAQVKGQLTTALTKIHLFQTGTTSRQASQRISGFFDGRPGAKAHGTDHGKASKTQTPSFRHRDYRRKWKQKFVKVPC